MRQDYERFSQKLENGLLMIKKESCAVTVSLRYSFLFMKEILFRLFSDISQNTSIYVQHKTVHEIRGI